MLIDRDPLRNILDIPPGDLVVETIERPIRTIKPIIPEENVYVPIQIVLRREFLSRQLNEFLFSEMLPPHVQTCVRCYTADWKMVRYQFRALSSSTATKICVPRTLQSSPKQEFEIDFQGTPSEASSEIGKLVLM